MGEYLRETHVCTLDSMRPILANAIRTHIKKFDLGDIEETTLISCETISTKQKKGFFGSKSVVDNTAIILTPKFLIWSMGRENEKPGTFSARLRDIRIQDYEKSDMNKMLQDSGINIYGIRTDGARLSGMFIGLGTDQVGGRFREILRGEIAKV